MKKAYSLLLSFLVLLPASVQAGPPFAEFVDPNPNPGNQFGATVLALSTGNVVITSPFDDAGGTDAGAVYLFNGATGALISTLRGSTANDQIGSAGVRPLGNGNYVVRSPNWDNGAIRDAGAATWGSGTTGISGVVSSSNSLVGTSISDAVSLSAVFTLGNGHYLVHSASWDNGSIANAGAVTWGNGNTGITGAVSSSNSLVGSTANDMVGNNGGIVVLSNGNYVITSRTWDQGTTVDVGAVTWASGATGISGVVSSSNSLIGSTTNDQLGAGGVIALKNGNYLVRSPNWDNGSATDAGAVTWGNGTAGIVGTVSSSNSLIGSTSNDQIGVGNGGITVLSNGNYVIVSRLWDNGAITDAGAVTWGSDTTGVSGVVSSSNSLVGSTSGDTVGVGGVTALTNGNYTVSSYNWDSGALVDVGAVTWGNGTTGISGLVSSSNSLIGTTANDQVGIGGATALSNGHYVVRSSLWDNGATINAGAVTWCNGNTGHVGVVSSSNSLVGSITSDQVGSGGAVTALTNGNYVVSSPIWDNGTTTDVGAVTWCSGTASTIGPVTSSNSLVGSTSGDQVGGTGLLGIQSVTALSNGNYVVRSPQWDNGAATNAGAVTWGSGSTGVRGVVSSSNSLVGSTSNDQIGSTGATFSNSITLLSNGNYVLRSPLWDNGAVSDAGAVTWANGSTGVSGVLSSSNSIVGSTATDQIGSDSVTALTQGSYVICSPLWNNGTVSDAGAVTWGSGTTAITGFVSSSNSLVGSTASDQLGSFGVMALSNGNYLVRGPNWDNGVLANAGALTWGSGSTGISGTVSSSNSLIGLTSNTSLQFNISIDNVNATFFGVFLTEDNGKVRLGSQLDGLASTALPTVTTVSPGTGSSLGGTSVAINGTGFTGATGVTFGGVAASGVVVVSDTIINCTTPAGSAGPASVLITTPTGTNAANTLFTYLSANADLTNLVLSNGTLTPTFASGTLSYDSDVLRPISSLTLTATTADAGATLAVRANAASFAAATSGSPSASQALNLGNNTLDIRVTAQDGITQKTYTVTLRRLTHLEAWRRTHYSIITDTGNAADSAAPQDDGLSNLMKFALGMTPTVPGVQPIGLVKNGANLEFTYPRSIEAMDECTFTVEWSDTLLGGSWSTAGVTEQVLSSTSLLQQVKATFPAGSIDRRFARLRVTAP